MKRFRFNKGSLCGVVMLITVPLIAASCTTPIAPTTTTTTTQSSNVVIDDATEAKDAALDFLNNKYSNDVPAKNISWQMNDITPADILGSITKSFDSTGWEITISYPVVNPEQTVYHVMLDNKETSFHWEGNVEANGNVTETSTLEQLIEEQAQDAAEKFMKNSPTFTFDGIPDSLKLIETITLRTPNGWQFVFEFKSLHGGYGDRTGQMVLQAITPHTAIVTIINGKVIKGTMDEQWDMVNQESTGIVVNPIKEMTEEESQTLAEWFLKNDPTFVFDGIPETLMSVDSITVDGTYAWQFTFEFQSRNAGYGDRTGQIVAQVVTPHTVVITVIKSEIVKAVMDGQYDMLTGEMIETDSPAIPGVPPLDDGTISTRIEFTYDQLMEQKNVTKEIEVNLPGSLIVTLWSNPTTGFKWQDNAEIGDPAVLSQYSHQFVEPKSDMMGAAGEEVFVFKTLEKGTSTVQLQYSRSWESNEQAEWTVELTVTIK